MAFATIWVRARDGTRLAVGAAPCGGEGPVVLLLHGLFSHMGWYRGLAEQLVATGAAVYALDRRGAGLSHGARGHMPHWTALVHDVGAVAQEIRSLHPGRKIHAIGISLGGAISLAASILHPELFASQILLSPGLAPGFSVSWRQRLRLLRTRLLVPQRALELPFSAADLTDDQRWRDAVAADPLRTRQVTARFLVETFRMQRFVRAHMARVRVPLLALLAERDRLVDNDVAIEAMRRAGSRRVRVEIFAKASHILPASVPSSEILARFAGWLRQPGPEKSEELSIVAVPEFLVAAGERAFDPPELAGAYGRGGEA